MMDENQQNKAVGFGMRLKLARELLHLSQKDAATRLHLSPKIIQTLESENGQDALPPTFMRGYLRSYARLLNMTEEEINVGLAESGLDSAPIQPIVPKLGTVTIERNDRSGRYVHWTTSIVVLVLCGLVGMWWSSHPHYTSTSTETVAHSDSQQPAAVVAAPTAATTNATALTATPTATTTPIIPSYPAPETATTPAQQAVANSNTAATNTSEALPPTTTQPALPAPIATNPTNNNSVLAQPVEPPALAVAPSGPAIQPAPAPAAITPGLNAANTTQPITTPAAPLPPVAGINPPQVQASTINPLTLAPIQQPNTEISSSQPTNKKHRPQNRVPTENVSGMAMALPEPGLESN
ncbi:MAG: helix-turn-helix domain-containing protein [Gammaproteobacteria bacterium]